jgi:hypothetical protein
MRARELSSSSSSSPSTSACCRLRRVRSIWSSRAADASSSPAPLAAVVDASSPPAPRLGAFFPYVRLTAIRSALHGCARRGECRGLLQTSQTADFSVA